LTADQCAHFSIVKVVYHWLKARWRDHSSIESVKRLCSSADRRGHSSIAKVAYHWLKARWRDHSSIEQVKRPCP
jgi:hypothetical protein